MSALLRAELIKLRTTRTFVALASVAVGTSLLLTALIALLDEPAPDSVISDVFQSDTSGLFIMILAIVGITGEWRHRTITSSLLAAPHRVRFLAAKTVAFAAAGIVLSLLVSIAVTVVGVAILELRNLYVPPASELLEQLWRNVSVAWLPGALGVGVGALLRNQAVAIVTILVVAFVVEPTLTGLAPDVARFGPTGALPVAASGLDAEALGYGDLDLLPAGLALLALLGWIGGLFAGGAALLRTRDVD